MIYLDNCATTKTDKKIADILYNYNTENFFNPSALYNASEKVKIDISNARKNVAKAINAAPDEIIFTSCGTESNNSILNGVLKPNDTLIISAGEHASIYNTAQELIKKNINVKICPLNQDGSVNLEKLLELTDSTTILISILHVSNEFGTINDIKYITGRIKSEYPQTLIHSDGVQALGKINIDIKDLGVDFYSASSHKLYAPKGCGIIYKKKGVKLNPFIFGGGQENNMRSGTENTGAIIAFSEALKIAVSDFKTDHFHNLRTAFIDSLNLQNFKINGGNVLNNILSISIPGIKSEVIVHILENKNIFIGTGSACSANKKSFRISDAIGLTRKEAEGTLRISFSKYNTIEEVKFAAQELSNAVNKFINRETI